MIAKLDEIETAVNHRQASTPLNDTSWRRWLARNHTDEMRRAKRRIAVIKSASIVLLLAAGLLWTVIAPYQRPVIFAIALGAFAVMFNTFHTRRYVLAAVFGAIVFLYNPLIPTLPLSGQWQRLILLATTVPFLASLVWHEPPTNVPVRVQAQ